MSPLDHAPRQREILEKVAALEAAHQPVTTQSLTHALLLPRQNVRQYLLALRDKGLVHYEASDRQRAVITLTEEGRKLTERSYPVLGTVAAGHPILAEGEIQRYVTRLEDVLDLKPGDFLLTVSGDSMIGAGIFDGDLVAIRPSQAEPLKGEIVLVLLPDASTATLKRWNRLNGVVSLHSENPAYAPIVVRATSVEIQGCLVGHVGTGRARKSMPLPPA
ncbi:LexA family protein [Deinococcus radiophilus]|uniref:LexA family transcriptional regulator n=1 Tax=Deinococcus radiophilus TaxID=32062 RepID=A0A431W0Q0_9DEIO|nr:S24 family peptidase [Deinococcus radiophilus]RTR29087.1 LexA family transcriptional regulator [Deinococcus radiophilus]UFA49675.1 LexA family transcriptional regulator [Deinococcus radiophilus]